MHSRMQGSSHVPSKGCLRYGGLAKRGGAGNAKHCRAASGTGIARGMGAKQPSRSMQSLASHAFQPKYRGIHQQGSFAGRCTKVSTPNNTTAKILGVLLPFNYTSRHCYTRHGTEARRRGSLQDHTPVTSQIDPVESYLRHQQSYTRSKLTLATRACPHRSKLSLAPQAPPS